MELDSGGHYLEQIECSKAGEKRMSGTQSENSTQAEHFRRLRYP